MSRSQPFFYCLSLLAFLGLEADAQQTIKGFTEKNALSQQQIEQKFDANLSSEILADPSRRFHPNPIILDQLGEKQWRMICWQDLNPMVGMRKSKLFRCFFLHPKQGF